MRGKEWVDVYPAHIVAHILESYYVCLKGVIYKYWPAVKFVIKTHREQHVN